MSYLVYRDFRSIAFIRCVKKISELGYAAEGVGFSLSTAKEKCLSELIERLFTHSLLITEQRLILGIAAHPIESRATENALNEALETLFLEKLNHNEFCYGITFSFFKNHKIFISRVNNRWLSAISFPYQDTTAMVQSVSSSLISSVLKSWTELRNIKIYQPLKLSNYTRANKIFKDRIKDFRLIFSLRKNLINTKNLLKFMDIKNYRYIVYFKKENI
ncbi:MAG: hypothetical protein M9962_11175 [Oligoflexia bacterium]|nr:hypothetical protein [Oligoflexia bacterium]